MSGNNVKKLSISVLIGAGIGVLSSAILLLFMAAVLAVGNIPAMLISPATVFVLAFGSFCGGFAGAKLSGEKGLLCGAITGILFFAIVLISGGIMEKTSFGIGMAIKLSMMLISSSLGGIFGVNYIKRK
ncbi:MAG: TIGR04086 family membrane protein [Oscillospiraceae bacterium]|nr:TIGR04086 family membrane protein [Oscillospiraceae bacterium]